MMRAGAFALALGTLSTPALSAGYSHCGADEGNNIAATELKLRLIDQGYSVINLNFNPTTGCYFLYGYNDQRDKVYAFFSASSGKLMHEALAN